MLRKARIKKVMIIKDKVAQIRIQTVYILQIAEWGDKCSKSSSRLFKAVEKSTESTSSYTVKGIHFSIAYEAKY